MRDAFSTNADLVGYANARITSLRKAQRLKMEYWDTVRRTMEVGSRLFLYTYNDTKSQKTETGVFVLDANGNIVKRLEVMTSESSSMSKQIEKVE
jgi:hypothetical protein